MVTRRLFKGKKVVALITAFTLSLSSLGVMAAEATITSDTGLRIHNVDVTVTGSGSSYNNINNFYDGSPVYKVNGDGTASLSYNVGTQSVNVSSNWILNYQNFDSNYYYYKTNENEEWKKVEIEDMKWGSSRATGVTFQLDNSDVNQIFIQADIYRRDTGALMTTIEGTVDFQPGDQLETSVSMTDDCHEGQFANSATITMSASPSNASIYYTIDGIEKLYESPIEITETSTISAYATLDGYLAPVTSNTYTKISVDGFGNANIAYEPGEYPVTISTMKEGKAEESSYASLVSTDATLVVDADGNGSLVLELAHGTMMSMDCYLEDITYYNTNGKEVSVEILEYFDEESYINKGEHPAKMIKIPIENKRDYCIGMNAQAGTNSWYVNYHDFDVWIEDFRDGEYVEPEAEEVLPEPEVEDTGFFFGSTETELAPGKYVIDAKFMKANDHAEDSMSQDAVNGDIILEVKEDASATVSVEFIEMVYGGIASNVSAFRYYTSDTPNASYVKNATINTTNILGLPNDTTINITNKALDGIYTNFDVLYIHSNLDAYLTLNYETATPYVEPVYEVLTATGDTSYDASQGGTVTFKINGSYTEFKELRINGMLIPTTYYTVRDTSIATISLARYGAQSFEVILSEELLAMLPSGSNQIEVYTENGLATMSLEIENGNDEVVYKFGSQNTELAPGTYTIDAQFLKANDHEEVSMSDDAVEGDYILTVAEDGKATISMNFVPMDYDGFLASVSAVRYYTSAGVDAAYLVDATINTTDDNDMPNNVIMNITDNSLDGLYVNFDVLYIHSDLDAYLAFDYETAEVYVDNTTSDDAQDTPQDTTVEDVSDAPQTGDNTSVVLYLSLLMLSMVAMYAIKREENK